jgi:transposase
MSKARLVITAVIVEKCPVSEAARRYGVARSWIYTLLARYRAEGEAAFEPRSRRPGTSLSAISPGTVDLIVRLRKELSGQGLDAGPHTIAWHLAHHHHIRVSAATISRYLARAGLVTPEPAKRPRSSYIRFAAEQPNECWQAGFTHYPLAGGADTEILTWLDDHSRFAPRVSAHHRVTGPVVLAAFRAATAVYGVPAATLTDNGMVFTTRLSGGKGGRNGFEHELRRLGITQKTANPTTRKPRARLSGSSRPSKNGCAPSPPSQRLLDSCRPRWTLSPPATTTTARTGRYPTAPPRPPPTTPGPKPPPATGQLTPTTASAATASTPTANSPSGWAGGCTTSASAEPTPGPLSSC